MRSLRIIVLAVLAFLLSMSASATTYYVAPDGSNADPGTKTHPWRTIASAACPLSPVTAGDTILVRQGTYNEAVVLIR